MKMPRKEGFIPWKKLDNLTPTDIKGVVGVLEFSQAQLDTLAELAQNLKPTRRLVVEQTWTETGGWHVYAWNPVSNIAYHVAADGNLVELV